MSFLLEVQFTGLCVHISHPTRAEIAVLMPDARIQGGQPTPAHVDGSPSVPHVGYLQFDMACVPGASTGGVVMDGTAPYFEVVYRLDHQELDFGLPAPTAPITGSPGLPDILAIAPTLQLRPGMFSSAPPSTLLFRTRLQGGTVTPGAPDGTWSIDGRLAAAGTAPMVADFPGDVIWRREVDAAGLTLTLTSFDGSTTVTLPLHPVVDAKGDARLTLKVANLCADNVLEWEELVFRGVTGDDLDFKWNFALFEPVPPATWTTTLGSKQLPVPHLTAQPIAPRLGGGAGDCIGAAAQSAY